MGEPSEVARLTGMAARLGAFVAERHPFVVSDAMAAFEAAAKATQPADAQAIDALRPGFRRELTRRLRGLRTHSLPETTPRTSAEARLDQACA